MNNPFKKRFNAPRLSAEAADRQGRISKLALAMLGQAGAIAFLNTPNAALDGRPLDLAVRSQEGFAAVEQALIARGSPIS